MGTGRAIWVSLLLLFHIGASLAAQRQLIQTGWDSPTPAQFKSGIDQFEKWNLFDGAAIMPTRRVGDQTVICSSAFLTNHWEWSEFADCVRDLQAARPQRSANNFLMLLANPGNVGWFDDPGWNEIVDHWRLLARAARQGRMAGIIFDPEPYTKPWSQFLFTAQADKDSYTFAQMSAKARERGRAVMKAVGEEFPNMTLLAYRLFSDLPRAGDPSQPAINLQSSPYGLLPAFVDGWCDALPPELSIIDGNESAYRYESEQEYSSAFARLKLAAPQFVSPDNREKFRKQFFVGHGTYLDGYTPAAGAKPWFEFKERSPANRLMAFASAAMDSADGPIWIYGESAQWWPKQTNAIAWADKFPGIVEALRAAKDPGAFARDYLRNVKPQANLLRDVEFASSDGGRGPWFVWQGTDSKGKSNASDKGVVLTAMENGAFSQTIAVKPAELYAVGARVKSTGAGDVGVLINWQNSARKWIAIAHRVEFAPTQPPDPENWRQIAGLVRVPPDASNLVFLFFARKQDTTSHAAFRDPIVARVEK
jgi:hypothetical protein